MLALVNVRHVFSIGMQTSQWSKGMNNALKTFVLKKNKILKFVVRLQVLLNKNRE